MKISLAYTFTEIRVGLQPKSNPVFEVGPLSRECGMRTSHDHYNLAQIQVPGKLKLTLALLSLQT